MTINWQDVITTVATTVGGGAVLLGASAYLIKTALNQRLLLDAEFFKAKLKIDSDAEVERLKTSLQMTALEHQVRFSKLHEKRAEVIAELYKRLVEVSSLAKTKYEQGEEHKQSEAILVTRKKICDLIDFAAINQIYLPAHSCELLDKFRFAVQGLLADVVIFHFQTPYNDRPRSWSAAFKERMEDTMRGLESDFRAMLDTADNAPKPL